MPWPSVAASRSVCADEFPVVVIIPNPTELRCLTGSLQTRAPRAALVFSVGRLLRGELVQFLRRGIQQVSQNRDLGLDSRAQRGIHIRSEQWGVIRRQMCSGSLRLGELFGIGAS